MIAWVALCVAAMGAALFVVAALGVLRLPDTLSRQHAATKSATFALGLILLGVALNAPDWTWWLRVAAIEALLLVTLPVASHMLSRAAARHTYTLDELREAPHVGGNGGALER